MSSITAAEIASAIPGAELYGPPDTRLHRIVYDSRRAAPGCLFAALRGAKSDGHDFVRQALAAGASAAMVEPSFDRSGIGATLIVTDATRPAMALAACALYRHPSAELTVHAVTGTNGKTSTTHFIESIYRAGGKSCGVIGTLGAKAGDEWLPVEHTTPESPDLQELMRLLRDRGTEVVALEASSHAIAQHRLDCTQIDVAIFTNLTQDHLDFHGSMEEYFGVKAELFIRFAEDSGKKFYSVININDMYGREKLLPIARGEVWTYGSCNDARVCAEDLRISSNQTSFKLATPLGSRRVALRVGGVFNVYNSLAAAAACLAAGVPLETVAAGLESQTSVPGRFEPVDCGQPFGVIVDYAHTPDGLKNLLEGCRRISDHRLIAVFGCGGDRDATKRPVMGRIASEMSDIPILTSDNPRSEDPAAIARDVLEGVPADGRARMHVELDRRAAIQLACSLAEPGDIVIIAGKGHETYQIFADHTADFDDRQVVREVLASLEAQ